jgi:hypothetical protein
LQFKPENEKEEIGIGAFAGQWLCRRMKVYSKIGGKSSFH